MGDFDFVTGFIVALLLWCVARFQYLRWKGVAATATVVALPEKATSDGGTYSPVVAFTTADGVRVEAKGLYGTAAAGTYFRVGQEVAVRYLAKNPTCFSVVDYEVWLAKHVLLMMAVVEGVLYWFRSAN